MLQCRTFRQRLINHLNLKSWALIEKTVAFGGNLEWILLSVLVWNIGNWNSEVVEMNLHLNLKCYFYVAYFITVYGFCYFKKNQQQKNNINSNDKTMLAMIASEFSWR